MVGGELRVALRRLQELLGGHLRGAQVEAPLQIRAHDRRQAHVVLAVPLGLEQARRAQARERLERDLVRRARRRRLLAARAVHQPEQAGAGAGRQPKRAASAHHSGPAVARHGDRPLDVVHVLPAFLPPALASRLCTITSASGASTRCRSPPGDAVLNGRAGHELVPGRRRSARVYQRSTTTCPFSLRGGTCAEVRDRKSPICPASDRHHELDVALSASIAHRVAERRPDGHRLGLDDASSRHDRARRGSASHSGASSGAAATAGTREAATVLAGAHRHRRHPFTGAARARGRSAAAAWCTARRCAR